MFFWVCVEALGHRRAHRCQTLSHTSECRSAPTGRRRAGRRFARRSAALASGDLLLERRFGFADERRVEMESAILLRCGLLTRGERRFRADVPAL